MFQNMLRPLFFVGFTTAVAFFTDDGIEQAALLQGLGRKAIAEEKMTQTQQIAEEADEQKRYKIMQSKKGKDKKCRGKKCGGKKGGSGGQGAEVPYTLEKENMKCGLTKPTSRIYRLEDETLESCAAKCRLHAHCNFFSYGLHKEAPVCMGCSHATLEGHEGFTSYKMKDQKQVDEKTYLVQVKCDETVKGAWNTQIWVKPGHGNFGFVVHPGYKGSAVRFEGDFSKRNQDIKWTLAPNVYHTLKITFRLSGKHTLMVIDGDDPTKTWSYDFEAPGAYGNGNVGSVWVDTQGDDQPNEEMVLGKEFHLDKRGKHSFKLLEA